MNFYEVLVRAKNGDERAKQEILEKYKPLLVKNSILNGYFDEDLYQEQCLILMRCINLFSIDLGEYQQVEAAQRKN